MDIRARREQLMTMLRDTSIHLEQIRGALALCDEILSEGNNHDIQASGTNEREDGKPVG